jgi:hypothetical protein
MVAVNWQWELLWVHVALSVLSKYVHSIPLDSSTIESIFVLYEVLQLSTKAAVYLKLFRLLRLDIFNEVSVQSFPLKFQLTPS